MCCLNINFMNIPFFIKFVWRISKWTRKTVEFVFMGVRRIFIGETNFLLLARGLLKVPKNLLKV